MISFPIYLDNHSTTRVDDEVIEAMLPYFNKIYGNPSSTQHKVGWEAEAVVESSRNKIAEILKCEPDEIIFTSGATESNNLAILGIALAYSSRGKHIITTAIEHPSVLEPVKFLAKNGFETTIINPEPNGIVSIDKIFSKIRNDTILVTVMTANNEIGTLQPVKEIAEHCVKENIFFHTDAAQAFGKIQLNLSDLKADLVSLSGHKTHGPKGVGILFMRKKNPRIRLHKILYGGGQEKGLRSGTLNVPLIVGIRKCFEIVRRDFEKNYSFIKSLRDHLLNGFLTFIDGTHVNGSMELRLINNLNVRFEEINSDMLYKRIKDIAFSTSSACASGKGEESSVLAAIGLSEEQIKSSVRFGLSKYNSFEEIDYVIQKFSEVIKDLRKK